jgi:hypothetical protein
MLDLSVGIHSLRWLLWHSTFLIECFQFPSFFYLERQHFFLLDDAAPIAFDIVSPVTFAVKHGDRPLL